MKLSEREKELYDAMHNITKIQDELISCYVPGRAEEVYSIHIASQVTTKPKGGFNLCFSSGYPKGFNLSGLFLLNMNDCILVSGPLEYENGIYFIPLPRGKIKRLGQLMPSLTSGMIYDKISDPLKQNSSRYSWNKNELEKKLADINNIIKASESLVEKIQNYQKVKA